MHILEAEKVSSNEKGLNQSVNMSRFGFSCLKKKCLWVENMGEGGHWCRLPFEPASLTYRSLIRSSKNSLRTGPFWSGKTKSLLLDPFHTNTTSFPLYPFSYKSLMWGDNSTNWKSGTWCSTLESETFRFTCPVALSNWKHRFKMAET
jgi:hypothetical protein